jgi:uncharacterized protein YsxB (DUF464 family)
MGEIVIQRDERNRVLGLTSRGMVEGTLATTSAFHFLRAAVASMTKYLHVSPDFSVGEEIYLGVKRSDLHLNREIDAIMETLVMGLKILAEEYPDDLVVHEATIGIQV